MPRAIWSGSISFGLVNVPVKLYSAVHHQDLSFHQFEEGTNARVRNKRVSEKTGKEVAYDDIVKGYEVTKGNYVMVDPDELAEFAPQVAPAELKMAAQIVESMAREWDPKRYEDTYRVEVLDFLKKKAAGEEIVTAEEPEEESSVVDLMAALEASLEAAKKGGARKASSSSKSSSSKSRSSSSSKSSSSKSSSSKSSSSKSSSSKSSS